MWCRQFAGYRPTMALVFSLKTIVNVNVQSSKSNMFTFYKAVIKKEIWICYNLGFTLIVLLFGFGLLSQRALCSVSSPSLQGKECMLPTRERQNARIWGQGGRLKDHHVAHCRGIYHQHHGCFSIRFKWREEQRKPSSKKQRKAAFGWGGRIRIGVQPTTMGGES